MAEVTSDINQVIESLSESGVILTPTDTIWGLSADARSPEALNRLRNLKKRNQNKGIIVLVHNDVWLERCVRQVPDVAWDLIDHQTKPTTIIFQEASPLFSHISPPDKSLAVRLVKTGPISELLKRFNAPLLSTSANLSNAPSPQQFDAISEDIKSNVDLIFFPENYTEDTSQASSIIKLNNDGGVQIIRK